jgi:hypothetical protein
MSRATRTANSARKPWAMALPSMMRALKKPPK